jgi:DNA-binding IclR family transcriptional regulator
MKPDRRPAIVERGKPEGKMAKQTIKSGAAVAEKTMRRRIPKWAMRPGETATTDQQYYLRTIGRALNVLDSFDGQVPISLKEISARVKLPETTVFRVLLTLEKHKYLHQNRDGTYQLAPKLLFGWLVQAADSLRHHARPEMERLANTFGETVSLSYLYDDRIHVLDCIETFHEIRMTNKVGRVLPPHCSAMGKVITAFQERPLADRILEVYGLTPRTEHTIVDRQKLFKEFEEARKTGLSADREESIRGGICFGAAMRTKSKPVVAALSISTPIMRMTPQLEQDIKTSILDVASRLAGFLDEA